MAGDEPKVGKNRGNAGKGRPKGAANKLTKTIKEAIELSFEKVGGADYLARMAEEQPSAYMTLLGKVLPTQVTGEDGGPVKLHTIRREFVSPKG